MNYNREDKAISVTKFCKQSTYSTSVASILGLIHYTTSLIHTSLQLKTFLVRNREV